jgi:hypothetical protein
MRQKLEGILRILKMKISNEEEKRERKDLMDDESLGWMLVFPIWGYMVRYIDRLWRRRIQTNRSKDSDRRKERLLRTRLRIRILRRHASVVI